MHPEAGQIFTIGHSTHLSGDFVGLLRACGVELVADVRRYPGSRRNPQFNLEPLTEALEAEEITLEGFGETLGGRRKPRRDSPNGGWRVDAFRGYADHMRSAEFAAGLALLGERAAARATAVMCAEGDWRRCHRRLIADALLSSGWKVLHILPAGDTERHEITPFAVVGEEGISYPPLQPELS